MEIWRYRLRAKVWKLADGEPSTWDTEFFRPLSSFGFNLPQQIYPYGNEEGLALVEYDMWIPTIDWYAGEHQYQGIVEVMFDNFQVYFDAAGGDPTNSGLQGSAWANVERPEGTELARIEMPDAQQLVYWGTRDWTDITVDDGPYAVFSQKLWSDSNAARMQRSEGIWSWFRSVHFTAKFASIFWHPYKKELTKRRYGG